MIEHFALGWVTPIISFLLSCAGCAVGLTCTARARVSHGLASTAWLALGAVSIGGTGIWVMTSSPCSGSTCEAPRPASTSP